MHNVSPRLCTCPLQVLHLREVFKLKEIMANPGNCNCNSDKVNALMVVYRYRVVFLTGPALKVLSVEDGKIPTNKVKVRVCHRENVKI